MEEESDVLVSKKESPHGEGSGARLICLPPSGAGRSFYRQWPRDLAGAPVIPMSRPGHEERLREPFAKSLAEAGEDIAERIVRHGSGPAILFGHSLGAAVAFETVRILEGQGIRVSLVVSGRQAPHLPSPAAPVKVADNRALLRVLEDWGGPKLRDPDDPRAAMLLSAVRADFALSTVGGWDGRRVAAPVTSISYRDDLVVSDAAVRAWTDVAGGQYTHVVQPGDHLSARNPSATLVEILSDILTRIQVPNPGL